MNFFTKWKVLIFGWLTAIALPVIDLLNTGQISTKILIAAALTATISFLGRNFRGQWVSIAGIVLSSVITYLSIPPGEDISIRAMVLQLLIQILALVAPPAKSVGYERTNTIKSAKEAGELKVPTVVKPKPNQV